MSKWISLIKEYRWQVALPALALLIGLSLVVLSPKAHSSDQTGLAALPTLPSQSSSPSVQEEEASTEERTFILVDVKGAVEAPGLYEVQATDRVNDAIRAAGGMTGEADPKSVNLAQKVKDEMVIYVARQGEEVAPAHGAGSAEGSQQQADQVNINTATEAELQTISGIGAKRAADIIAYREANGGFKTVDDLNNVSGIGDKSLEKLRPYVTVD